MPAMLMDHAVDPREELRAKIGDISDITIAANNVLIAVYKRPEKTKSGSSSRIRTATRITISRRSDSS
jgi:hypothetical protein